MEDYMPSGSPYPFQESSKVNMCIPSGPSQLVPAKPDISRSTHCISLHIASFFALCSGLVARSVVHTSKEGYVHPSSPTTYGWDLVFGNCRLFQALSWPCQSTLKRKKPSSPLDEATSSSLSKAVSCLTHQEMHISAVQDG